MSNPCRVSPVSCYASGLLLQVIRKKIPKSQLINELKKIKQEHVRNLRSYNFFMCDHDLSNNVKKYHIQ